MNGSGHREHRHRGSKHSGQRAPGVAGTADGGHGGRALSAPALMSTAPVVELTLTVTPVGVVNMCRGPDVLDTHFTVSGAVVGDGVRVDDGVEPVG